MAEPSKSQSDKGMTAPDGWDGQTERRTGYQELLSLTRENDKQQRIISIVIGILASVSIGIAAWALVRVVNHEVRIAKIESNLFTSEGGQKLMDRMVAIDQKIQNQLYDIRERIVQLPTRDEIPPQWFKEKVEKLQRRMEKFHGA